MNKEIVAAVMFITIWLGFMLLWGNYKGIEADLSGTQTEDLYEGGGTGHPLWR